MSHPDPCALHAKATAARFKHFPSLIVMSGLDPLLPGLIPTPLIVMPGLDPGIQEAQMVSISNMSRQSGFCRSIKASFHARLQCLMFFSL